MKLSTCITENIGKILQDWENFAQTLFPLSQQKSAKKLRNHAKQILLSIIANLEHTTTIKFNKYGQAKKNPSEQHGATRLEQGFTINEITLEYQELRKNIIHFFQQTSDPIHNNVIQELILLNAALDQSLNDAVLTYSSIKEQHRNIQKEAEAIIWHSANYDYLTDVANRRRFSDKLEANIKKYHNTNKSFALFFIDLDKFKNINDQFGHKNGDLLLQIIANRIKSCVRETDLVARIGGDEFTIILNNYKNIKQTKNVALKLLNAIRQPINLNSSSSSRADELNDEKKSIKNTNIDITASIGLGLYPISGNTSDTLLNHADKAMYHAKTLGGNQYFLS